MWGLQSEGAFGHRHPQFCGIRIGQWEGPRAGSTRSWNRVSAWDWGAPPSEMVCRFRQNLQTGRAAFQVEGMGLEVRLWQIWETGGIQCFRRKSRDMNLD